MRPAAASITSSNTSRERIRSPIIRSIANPVLSREEVAADGGKRQGERLLAEGADLVAPGRGFLANPDLVERLRTGARPNEIPPEFLMHVQGQGAEGYTDYPVLGRTAYEDTAAA
ncbi:MULTISPECIES: hypothetical protein [unclassified Streptomyces]|uniref:hypothetical protein n=1 Tax=unclassified Streptomyces TaxID=2593676 RepID=UPI002E14F519